MESIFDLEHPYKNYFKMTLPSVLGMALALGAAGRKPRYPDGEQGSFPLK